MLIAGCGALLFIGGLAAGIGYSYRQISYITSQEWVEGSCKVHGMWIEQRWTDGHTTSSSSFNYGRRRLLGRRRSSYSSGPSLMWQPHFEVEVVGKDWKRADACYYDSCSADEASSGDGAADKLDEILMGACEEAGYKFDDGMFDFVDTHDTNSALQRGLNCEAPSNAGQPPPPPPPSPMLSLQTNPYGQILQTGAMLGGGSLRAMVGRPCKCAESYPCWYNIHNDNILYPDVKMSHKLDPVAGYYVIFGICSIFLSAILCFGCCACAGQLGVGPLSSGAKFNRAWNML